MFPRSASVIATAAVLSGCGALQPPAISSDDMPGFWLGWWHGATALFSLMASLFSDVRIYAYPNSGFGYDAGFTLAVVGWAACWAAVNSQ